MSLYTIHVPQGDTVTVHQNIRAYIATDASISQILTGGVYDLDSIDEQDKGGADWAPRETNGVRIAPHLKMRWGEASPYGENILLAAESESLELYIYQDTGYDIIHAVTRRLKAILHNSYFTGDDVDYSYMTFANLTRQTNAEELGDASLRVMSFQHIYLLQE